MKATNRDAEQVGRRLKLRDLRILMTVAECGTMGKAAQRLAVSQPVVSKAISDMEYALGVQLLDRSRTGVEPTAQGHALIRRGTAIFDEMQQGLKDLEVLADPAAGKVAIAATPPVAGAIVAPAIEQLFRRFPRIRFKTVVSDTAQLFAELEARKVDIVISRIAHRLPEDYRVDVLFHDALAIVTGSKNPLAKRRNVRLAELLGEPWLLSSNDSYFGALQADVFRASGLDPPRTAVEVSAHNVRMELLANNRFLAIVAGFSVLLPRPHPGLVALPVKLRVPRDPVGIVTLKNRSLGPAVHLFIDRVREITKPLSEKA